MATIFLRDDRCGQIRTEELPNGSVALYRTIHPPRSLSQTDEQHVVTLTFEERNALANKLAVTRTARTRGDMCNGT